jgi:nicotinamidase-related amidase
MGDRGMTERRNGRRHECVVVDLNTQRDFCDRGGAQPVANVDTLIPTLRRVVAWARRNCVPVISSMEAHRKRELSDSGYPVCCVDGTGGQRKVEFTVFPKHLQIEIDNTLSLPINLFQRYQQVIFRKRADDLLSNPKADRLLTHLPVHELVIMGNGLESSVKALVLALRAREKPVSVVVDACGYWHKGTADLALRQMAAKGAMLITVDDLVRRKLDRRLRSRYRITIRSRTSTGATVAPNNNGLNGNGRNGCGDDGNGNGNGRAEHGSGADAESSTDGTVGGNGGVS